MCVCACVRVCVCVCVRVCVCVSVCVCVLVKLHMLAGRSVVICKLRCNSPSKLTRETCHTLVGYIYIYIYIYIFTDLHLGSRRTKSFIDTFNESSKHEQQASKGTRRNATVSDGAANVSKSPIKKNIKETHRALF